MAASRPNHTAADQRYLDGIYTGKLREFRDYHISRTTLRSFLTIVFPVLREFLARNNSDTAVAALTAASTSIHGKLDDERFDCCCEDRGICPVDQHFFGRPSSPRITRRRPGGIGIGVRFGCADHGDSDIQEISEALIRGASRSSSVPTVEEMDLDEPDDTSQKL
ncbi:hypothetical protein C8R43DRAFT_261906 [Mycena crocata]|nr:hypothetical protein C8R43DRAFT_261906 [Mycena crocata]